MGESELKLMAGFIADILAERQGSCRLTEEEQRAVVDLIKTKKSAVKALLWVWGALVLWILKDAYSFFINHFSMR